MATIDLIVLGMLKDKPLSAYEIQKLVEYRNISKWVKISTPSIYKKVIQLEKKGYILGKTTKEGNMPEKAVYTLTRKGEEEFENLMFDISSKPINILLDFNSVIVNLDNLPIDKQKECINRIEANSTIFKSYLRENLEAKKNLSDVPEMGKAVLYQQIMLVEAIEEWIKSVKQDKSLIFG